MANSAQSLAVDLAQLARESSSRGRVELLRRITAAILDQPDEPSVATRYLLNDIVASLLEKVGGSDRAAYSSVVASLPTLPETVEWSLASDQDIAVATPILREHRGTSEKTLVGVATTASQDHLIAIAGRRALTPPVTDVVVERGSKDAVRALAANHGAQFSDHGMRTLIHKSQEDASLQAMIAERPDLSVEAINTLLPIVSQELASRLRAALADLNVAEVGDHIADWMEDRRCNIDTTDGLIEAVREGGRDVNAAAMHLIGERRLFDLATLIASIIDLDRYHTFNVISQGKPQGALLMMKSIGLQWPVVDAFFKLRRVKMPMTADDESVERVDYDAIDLEAARRAIRFMKVRRVAAANEAQTLVR